jgi:hypothetical protein
MSRLGLEAVLSRDVNARSTGCGGAPALTGAGAVCLEMALCTFKAPCLGFQSSLATLMLKHSGKELVARIKRCPAGDLPLTDCLRFSRGHVRYVSLRAGGHLTERTELSNIVSWFPDRPHELWYAILDAKLTKVVPIDVLPMLPKRAAFALLMSGRYDLSRTMVLDLVPKALVSHVVSRHAQAMAPLDWVTHNLRGDDLVATLTAISEHRNLPSGYVLASAIPTTFKIDLLQKSGCLSRMTPEELVAAFPGHLLPCVLAGGRPSTFPPDWLKDHLEGADLFFVLVLGGHLGSLSADWIVANLPWSLVGNALAGRTDLDPEWVVANVPRKDVLKCLGNISNLPLDFLEANVHVDDLYHAVVIGGHASKLPREWFLEKLPAKFALRGMSVYGHIGPEDRDFLFSGSFPGTALLDTVISNGMDPGHDMTLEQLSVAYGPDALFRALSHMNRINSEFVDDLATVLSPDDMKDVLIAKGCVDEDEFARFLGGELLLEALLEADILDQCSIEYLCDNFRGRLLFRALEAGDHFTTGAVDTDCVLELFEDPGLAMEALEASGTMSMLTHEQAVRAFGSSTALLRLALVSAWETPVMDPDDLIPLFGDDKDSLAAVVRETTAYARMDPDDFPKYGIPV